MPKFKIMHVMALVHDRINTTEKMAGWSQPVEHEELNHIWEGRAQEGN
jgi:hypothetical protein